MSIQSLVLAIGAGLTLFYSIIKTFEVITAFVKHSAQKKKRLAFILIGIVFAIVFGYASYNTAIPAANHSSTPTKTPAPLISMAPHSATNPLINTTSMPSPTSNDPAPWLDTECAPQSQQPDMGGNQSTDGNVGSCIKVMAGFHYWSEDSGAQATWIIKHPVTSYVTSCQVDAWMPKGDKASSTSTRYDFWRDNTWLGWPGHDINQDTTRVGWFSIATTLNVDGDPAKVRVTAKPDGGTGNIAFAAMRFICQH
ncbi:hypothetical protein KDA_37590 [Dictyobacter alpinus]|uniref:Uncharacterized protein n=1 Tax=Dictyobacter alpinus TaxID=2014873 RepID=A0A402BA92_9CHLR|nr:hypothetical protein [Dictyobacter alpinus]GCE28275.1 hypothetical protein KDA_37590 [Dictyobacter alpinus]